VSLTIIVNNGKEQTRKKQKKYVKRNDYESVAPYTHIHTHTYMCMYVCVPLSKSRVIGEKGSTGYQLQRQKTIPEKIKTKIIIYQRYNEIIKTIKH